ncbi:MAG: hypothetical protein U0797_06335 [Gemmataceae bacterium]
MSDSDSRDDGKVGAFLLGFIVGVLVCLTGGGVFFMVQQRRLAEHARMAQMEAEAARAMAEEARARAEAERRRALDAVEAEKKARAKE